MRQKKIRSMIIAVIIVSVVTAVLYFGLNIKNVLEVKEQTTKIVSTIDKDNEDVTEKKQVKPSKQDKDEENSETKNTVSRDDETTEGGSDVPRKTEEIQTTTRENNTSAAKESEKTTKQEIETTSKSQIETTSKTHDEEEITKESSEDKKENIDNEDIENE